MSDERRPSPRAQLVMRWAADVPVAQWGIFRNASQMALRRGIAHAMGGAFAVAVHTGRWRNTKDMDFYVRPEDRQRMVAVLDELGLSDYYDREAYDRGWIYRATTGDTIVDVIWSMANRRASVDDGWLARAPRVSARGVSVQVVPVEEMIWAKLYVLQRDRCDWPDVLNMIDANRDRLDWQHLLQRLGPDAPLLAGVLNMYAWLSPGRSRSLPENLWPQLGLAQPPSGPDVIEGRVALLDSRPWFGHQRGDDTP
jgi:hypothetical protein